MTAPAAVASPSAASPYPTAETIDALQRCYSGVGQHLIALVRDDVARAHTREMWRICLGGAALIILTLGLVGLTLLLILQQQYGAATAIFGTGVVATAIGKLGDRLMGGDSQ